MKRPLSFLIITFFILLGTLVLHAQTNLNGYYSYKSNQDSNSPSFSLTFERQDAVYYSFFYQGAATIAGKWTAENGIIRVVLTRGNENWTLKLKQKGADLELAETLPEKGLPDMPDFKTVLPAGTVFKKDLSQPTAPALTPKEIGKRVLKLVKSVRSLKDFSPQNIKLQTGIKVDFSTKYPNRYGYGGDVIGATDWFYNLEAFPFNRKDVADEMRFSFDYQLHEPLNPDTTVICKAFDFNKLTKELQRTGFSAPKPFYRNHGYVRSWTMERGKVSLTVSVKGGFYPKVDNCVTGLDISFSK